jgi:large subunit ribosomal protein L22
MEVKAVYKFARISPFKAREVTRHVQGLPVGKAVDVLKFTTKKAARLIGKTLKSAIANAENNFSLSAENLYVKEALIGDGPRISRYTPRAKGSASPIKKRMSHIRIVLAERDINAEEAKKASKKSAKKSASTAKKPTAAKKTKKSEEAKAE